METVVESQPQQTQPETPQAPAAPVAQSEEPSAQPEKEAGIEGAGKEAEAEESPQRRESRRQRQLNRLRERAIAAETELKLLREERAKVQQQPQEAPGGDEPKREKYGSYEEFIEARATWRAEQAAEAKARKILEDSRKSSEDERAKQSHDKALREWNSRIETARDEIEDFDEVTSSSESVLTRAMSDAIVESPQGARIAYYLAKNPAEAERISKLSGSRQAAEIVRLEEKVSQPAKQPSKAPSPINPVGTKGAEVTKDPSSMSDAEYDAWRKKRRAAKGLT